MNKKFSTLIAGFLLVSSVGAYAQTQSEAPVSPVQAGNTTSITSGNYYFLGDGDGTYASEAGSDAADAASTNLLYLVADPTTGVNQLYMKAAAFPSLNAIDSALWQINAETVSGAGVRFSFINKATGVVLTYDSNNAVRYSGGSVASGDETTASVLGGGSSSRWTWYESVTGAGSASDDSDNETSGVNDISMVDDLKLFFGSSNDSVMALTVNSDGLVYAYKYKYSDGDPLASADPYTLRLKPQLAGEYVMKPFDLNVKTNNGLNYMEMSFDAVPSGVDNPFAGKFQAQYVRRVSNNKIKNATDASSWNPTTGSTPNKNAYGDESLDSRNKQYVIYANNDSLKGWTTFGLEYDLATESDILTGDDWYDRDYVILNKVSDDYKLTYNYLHVDTAYYESTGATYKTYNTFAYSEANLTGLEDALGHAVISSFAYRLPMDAFRFKFVKNLATDEVRVEAMSSFFELANRAYDTVNTEQYASDGTGYTKWSMYTAAANVVGWDSYEAEYVRYDEGRDYLENPYNLVPVNEPTTISLSTSSAYVSGTAEYGVYYYNADDPTYVDAESDGLAVMKALASENTYPAVTDAGNNMDYRVLSLTTLVTETKNVVTLAEHDGNNSENRVNLIASFNVTSGFTSIPEGLYNVQVYDGPDQEVGAYWFRSLCADSRTIDPETGASVRVSNWKDYLTALSSADYYQDILYMPAFQYVVEKVYRTGDMAETSAVKVYSREESTADGENMIALYQFMEEAQTATDGSYYLVEDGDYTYKFIPVSDGGAAAKEYGHLNLTSDDTENAVYNFGYLSALVDGYKINVGAQSEVLGSDTILTVSDGTSRFELAIATKQYGYGYDGVVADGLGLTKTAYSIRVNDANKLSNDKKYVKRSYVNQEPKFVLTSDATTDTYYFLKENNYKDGVHYYAIIDSVYSGTIWTSDYRKSAVDDASAQIRADEMCSDRTSAFCVNVDSTIIYRELNGANTVVAGDVETFTAPTVANFYRSRIVDKEYLFESANQSQFNETGKGINYLGVRLQDVTFDDSTAIYVDTADIRNPFKPQYMLAVGVSVYGEGEYCPIHGVGATCDHTVTMPAQTWGRYLINAQDSVENAANGSDYQWESQYTRLAFVHAMHVGDTLVIFRNGEYPLTSAGNYDYYTAIEWARSADEYGVADSVYVMNVKDRDGADGLPQDDANYKFAFRLVDDDDARDFIIESHLTGNDNYTYTDAENAVEYRAVKVQNGVPVIARYADASEGIENAEWWNIDERCTVPTANSSVESAIEGVTVIGGKGTVTVQGASGKAVTITNILGKTVTSTTLTSDNATLAVPAGIVAVAVEGEDAVKVIVK